MVIIDKITQGLNKLDKITDQWCEPIEKFLDKHPELYKVCLVAIHIFRASCMFALMEVTPLPLGVTFGIMGAASILYRAAVEKRKCSWKFTIPALIGAGAIWTAKATIIALIAKAAFVSLATTLCIASGLLPLALYIGWICYLSYKDIENHLRTSNLVKKVTNQSCCF